LINVSDLLECNFSELMKTSIESSIITGRFNYPM